MAKDKIIFVVTNHSKLGSTGKNTGWYLPEVAHPYYVLTKAGYEIVYVSPKGRAAPMDEGSGEAFKEDKICQQFLNDKEGVSRLKNTVTVGELKPDQDFKALFYAGGHGPMWDLPGAQDIAKLAAKIYEQGGILGAVCHGTVGFVPVKLSNGDALVKDKTVTSFTNKEEDAVGLSSQMPFMLEDKLKELGATFVGKENWACNVQVSDCGRLVTGQNPASATAVGEKIVELLGRKK